MRNTVLAASLLLLLATEILRVYLIMPFPGSQQADTIDLAYWLDRNIVWLRLILALPVVYLSVRVFREQRLRPRIILGIGWLVYAVVFYLFNFEFLAEKIFLEPGRKTFTAGNQSKLKGDKLVIGVEVNGEARAYPIQYIGYHHQVRDTVGGEDIMVTYCTVCRTGRVFSPKVDGKAEQFRLVGMDHFNAMFEDATTRSWWRQATGEAVTGPSKGKRLAEIPSEQVSLAAWMRSHPASLVMQADTVFKEFYANMDAYDKGKGKSDLTRRDSLSWQRKSWVIGVKHGEASKAYDWNELIAKQMIQDNIQDLPLLLTIEADSATYHAWDRRVNGEALQFERQGQPPMIRDMKTGSVWNQDGVCIDGSLKGSRLRRVAAYQEFWHSWNTFQPATMK